MAYRLELRIPSNHDNVYHALTDSTNQGAKVVPTSRGTFEDWLAAMHVLDEEVIVGTKMAHVGLKGKWGDIKVGSTLYKVGDCVILKKAENIKTPTLVRTPNTTRRGETSPTKRAETTLRETRHNERNETKRNVHPRAKLS